MTVRRQAGRAGRQRPEFRLERARPLGRAASRPALRPDRPRRPDHPRRSSPPPISTSSRRVQLGHEFRIGGEGLTLGGQLTYAWAEPGSRRSGARHRGEDPARHRRGQLSAPPHPGGDPARRRRLRPDRPGVRFNGLDAVARQAPGRLRPARFRPDRPGQPRRPRRLQRRRAALADRRPGRASPGPRPARRERSLAARPSPAAPARARCRRAGSKAIPTATLLRFEAVRRVSPAAEARLRRSAPSRPDDRRPAAQLRAIFGRQLHDRARLRSRHPARRPRHRRPGRASLRQPRPAPGPRKLAWQAFAFLDAARVREAGRSPPSPAGAASPRPAAGLRAALGDGARLEAVLAVPLERAGLQAERGDPRLLLSFTTRLWPWSF